MVKYIAKLLLFIFICLSLAAQQAYSHFGIIKPDQEIVSSKEQANLHLIIAFGHPFEQVFMDMEKPLRFGVMRAGREFGLLDSLKPMEAPNGAHFWALDYQIKRPGLYWFFMEPKPYWEEAESIYIQHFTKVAIPAFGIEAGWEKPLGLPVEIIPSVRPFGLWTGNTFCGQVVYKGKAVPNSMVEVEYFNEERKVVAPFPIYTSQSLLTDDNGRFCYSMPKAGWWGFAALVEAEKGLEHNGKRVGLELGGVIWIKVRDMK